MHDPGTLIYSILCTILVPILSQRSVPRSLVYLMRSLKITPDVSHHLRVFTACVAFPVYKAVRIEHPSHFYVFNGLEEQPLKATQRVNVRPRHGWSYSLFLLSGPPSVFLLVQNQGSPWPVWWKVYILGRTTECCSPFHAAPDELFDAFLHPPPQWFLARHVVPVTSAKAS